MVVSQDDLDTLRTVDEVADRLHISKRTVFRYFETGELAYVRLGRRNYVTERNLMEYVNRHRSDAPEPVKRAGRGKGAP